MDVEPQKPDIIAYAPVERITPARAIELLGDITISNLPVYRQRQVKSMARKMAGGEWPEGTLDAIEVGSCATSPGGIGVFSWNKGVQVLLAAVESNVPIYAVVIPSLTTTFSSDGRKPNLFGREYIDRFGQVKKDHLRFLSGEEIALKAELPFIGPMLPKPKETEDERYLRMMKAYARLPDSDRPKFPAN